MGRTSRHRIHLGAVYEGDGRCRFLVWAPFAERVELHLLTPTPRRVPMTPIGDGYFQCVADAVPGTRYWYRLNGCEDRPDPASRFQPEGVHGPSQVVDPSFAWSDREWFGLPLADYVIYELHVGTFTPEGTFAAIIPRLEALRHLGVTAIELMPVAQFPGERNWGYDGVYPFAVQGSYGGPEQLRRLVDACHRHGLAVILDVVYNHLGPEGNYLSRFGPYFTDRYRTPWGEAVNFDGPDSDHVRRFFIDNACYWMTEFHIDALRLDAIHAIFDFSAETFLEELAEATAAQAARLNRRFYLIAESALNDARVIRSRDLGGFGIDAQWSDDLHHALHAVLTGERNGYYQDYGRIEDLARAYRTGFTYCGQYSAYRRRKYGNYPFATRSEQFIVCCQNHDQVGNRMQGERLSRLVSFEAVKLAAAVVMLSPYVPLLFMGEEYGEETPFQYFVSHGDAGLIDAVRRGRERECRDFGWHGALPDPQSPETFQRSRIRFELAEKGRHRILRDFYRELLTLRQTVPALADRRRERMTVTGFEDERLLLVHRWTEGNQAFIIFNLNPSAVTLPVRLPAGSWTKCLDSAEARWQGPGATLPSSVRSDESVSTAMPPHSVAMYQHLA